MSLWSGQPGLLSSIPRRFTKLTLDELRSMVAAVQQFFEEIEMASTQREAPSGQAEMQHHESTDTRPYTDTKKIKIISKSKAGDKKTENQKSTFSDVQFSEVLKTLNNEEMAELTQFANQGPQHLWQGLQFIAVERWYRSGGDHETCQSLFTMLGEHPATVLLLLITERAERGHVRNLSRYAAACAVKVQKGQFMWGAGLRAASQRVTMRNVA